MKAGVVAFDFGMASWPTLLSKRPTSLRSRSSACLRDGLARVVRGTFRNPFRPAAGGERAVQIGGDEPIGIPKFFKPVPLAPASVRFCWSELIVRRSFCRQGNNEYCQIALGVGFENHAHLTTCVLGTLGHDTSAKFQRFV